MKIHKLAALEVVTELGGVEPCPDGDGGGEATCEVGSPVWGDACGALSFDVSEGLLEGVAAGNQHIELGLELGNLVVEFGDHGHDGLI